MGQIHTRLNTRFFLHYTTMTLSTLRSDSTTSRALRKLRTEAVKLVTGKSLADALTVQVPDKDGAMGPYKKSDFKYDVKSGFLVF